MRLLPRICAAALGVGLALLVGEGIARLRFESPLAERTPLLRIQANPMRGWEMVPGEDHYTYTHLVSVNTLGLRGPELAPRAEGELRVLLLGDSLVYGQGVAEADTLPARLEAVLRERIDRPVTVVNGGLRAYSTPQELGLLRELGERIEPDLVLLGFYWNDIDAVDPESYAARLQETGPIAFDLRAAPEGLPLFKWRVKQLLRRSALLMAVHDAVRDTVVRPPWLDRADEQLALWPERLRAFRDASAALGADFAVCALPRSNALTGPDPSIEIVERACEAARAAGFPMPVLEDELRRTAAALGRAPIVPYDGHYDADGNQALAIDMALWLAERGLLDEASGADPEKAATE